MLLAMACSTPSSGPPNDGGRTNDGGVADGTPPPGDGFPLDVATSVVFVDGVVNGFATGVDGQAFNLTDARVCVLDLAQSKFLSQHAQPYDTPMPLANYPGIRQGSGLDLGSAPTNLQLDVYTTKGLESDAAWSPTKNTCDTINCKSGPACIPHVSFTVALDVGVNVLTLVDDPDPDSGFGVKLSRASFIDKDFGGGPNSLWGAVVRVADWNNGTTITTVYGDPAGDGGVAIPPLAPGAIASDISGQFETSGLRFDSTTPDHFGQTLDSIAYVANPAVTPPIFFDVRQNFVFALVGDPNDPTGVNNLGGRDPHFDRRGLHIAAVPYAAPHETP